MPTQTSEETKQPPAVIIVGAGLGGLMLATLLERIDVPYHIFERCKEIKNLGSALTIGANILPVFEQLGLLEKIKKISLPLTSSELYNTDMSELAFIDYSPLIPILGYEFLLFSRPKLYELLLEQVPAHKITKGKRVLQTEYKEGKVHIHCSDNTSYSGDILVGADGAYSGVRQSLYKQLDEKGLLPKEDLDRLSIGYISMVGVTTPQDPEKYPLLKDSSTHFMQVFGKDTRSYGAFSIADNEIAWMASFQLSQEDAAKQQFRNSEWGPESNESMLREFEDLPCPFGGTMKEIFDATPNELVSKVFLEEKIFTTWHHGRTVLIGDACHKMHPAGGLGAVNAMQDAVVLANCIYNMTEDATSKSITNAFDEYYRQRFHRAKAQCERSSNMSKVLTGQTWVDRVVRKIVLSYLPDFIMQPLILKAFRHRPQIAWLPLAENSGTGYVNPQEGRRKLLEVENHGRGKRVAATPGAADTAAVISV